ncbi:RGL1 RHO1 GEF localizing protein 1 [Candida maltosa Xu316]|uniref:Arrestin C-terminal-like domain-containing protein n=1 Tax=Candida maltosa (strain Xu316) TaxID=1245528 RepID=M3ITK9_CANMX|nr:hypothetical protein G210_5096 [Candida maltosa Xu316]
MLFQTSSSTETVECPITVRLEANSSSIVKGCPGIPRSIPRIETTINIRSINEKPFLIRSVTIKLMTIQKVNVPTKFGTNEAFKEFKIYEDPLTYHHPPTSKKFYQELHGLDIPVLIPIPKDITPSGYSPTFGATTMHNLVVFVSLGSDVASELNFRDSFPVDIKTYDTLPIYRQYNEPILETCCSSDNQVVVDVAVPVTSIGPDDDLKVVATVKTNSANNKVKKNLMLRSVTFQVKEVLEGFDGGLPPKKEVKIHTETQLYESKELNSQGVSQAFSLKFPYENDYLELFEQNHPPPIIEKEVEQDFSTTIIESINISKLKTIDKLPEGVPVSHIQGFTLSGGFYSLWFEIVIKVKLSHAKDTTVHIPIIICPFNKESSKYLLQWIMQQCEIAKELFGKEFNRVYASATSYSDMIKLINQYRKPPIIYTTRVNNSDHLYID